MQQNQTDQNQVAASQKGKNVAKSYKRAMVGISGGVVALLLASTLINSAPPVEMKMLVKGDTVVCQIQVNDDQQSYTCRLDGFDVEEAQPLDYGENQVTFTDLPAGSYMLTVVVTATNEVVTSTQIEIAQTSAKQVVWMNLLLDKVA